MEKLKINDLLRYALSGGITLFTLYLLDKSMIPFIDVKDFDFIDATFIGVFALIIGSIIYTIHRAVLYPLVYRLCLICLILRGSYGPGFKFKSEQLVPWFPTELELKIDIERWMRRKDENRLQGDLTEWGSQVHYLLTSLWGIIAVQFLYCVYAINFDEAKYNAVRIVANIFFIASIITLLRHLIYEIKSADAYFTKSYGTYADKPIKDKQE